MNDIDINKILKMGAIILLIFVAVGTASHFHKKNSMTLDEYAKNHPGSERQPADVSGNAAGENIPEGNMSGNLTDASADDVSSNDMNTGDSNRPINLLTGALLNGGADGQAMLAERITYHAADGTVAEDFYYEPLSENLQRYITGVSYPAVNREDSSNQTEPGQMESDSPESVPETSAQTESKRTDIAITYSELRYVHVMHYDFEGVPTEGELICNASIADDFLDIFYELYRNEYQIEKICLIDEYNGDDTLSMEENNTSCFNYRVVEGSSSLSKHAYGLAIDVNPFYNPYITYNGDGTEKVSPVAAQPYADRKASFPYKIDENDLCYKLFVQHGFTWGGNWNSSKDYQHFQKAP